MAEKKERGKKGWLKEKRLKAANKPLHKFLEKLGIEPLGWDYLIVSDGSGTTLNKPCGWCGVLVCRGASFERKYFYGAMSTGTNVMAEMMGFVQPLLWLSKHKGRTKPARVHVITDCEVVRNTGNRAASRKSNRALWHFIGALEREIGSIQFHWLARESTALNRFADRVAGMSRKLLLEEPGREAIELLGLEGAESIYDLNPS